MTENTDALIADAGNTRFTWRRCIWMAGLFFLVLTGLRLAVMASGFPNLSGDEAQYWDWSRQLDWCYYSKPPGVAVLIHMGTSLFGDTVLGVRSMAAVLSLLASGVMYLLAARLYDRRVGLVAAVLLQIMPLFSAFGFAMTPDTPLIFFWLLSLLFLHRAWSGGASVDWLLLGCALGLGMLCKYAIGFLYVPIVLLLIATAQGRKRLRTPWPYVGLVLSLAFFVPVVIWNSRHDWVMFRHDLGHTNAGEGLVFSPVSLLEFVGSQLGMVTPIACVLILYLLIQRRSQDPFCFWVSIPILAGFLLKSVQGKIQANWPLGAWLIGVGVLARFLVHRYPHLQAKNKRLAAAGIIIPAVATLLLHVPFITLNLPWPAKGNPFKKLLGWDQLGREVSRLAETMDEPVFFFSDHYMITAELAFYVEGQPRAYCANFGRRLNQYDIWGGLDDLMGQNAVFVGGDRVPDDLTEAFDRIEAHSIDIHDRYGHTIRTFTVCRCYGFGGWTPKSPAKY